MALAFEEINKSHYLRRFFFNEKDSFVQVLILKAKAAAQRERIIPQLFRLWQRWEAQPISRSGGACGRGWLTGLGYTG